MSTNKHIDKICIAAVCLMLVLTILFMNGGSLGISAKANAMKYESTLFDTSYVHTIDIVMNDWDSFIENCESEEYASCTVVIDGNQYKNTAIRAKGNTSLSSVKSLGSQRYSFKLEFDHYQEGKSCDGLDKLCLNNLIQDNTMMKDYIAYMLMDDFGVDSPLCSFVYITVNGEDWGLYLAVEGVEDSFLKRNYGSDSGELYKPDSLSFGGGRGNGKDFDMGDFDFGSSDSEQSEGNMAQTTDESGGDSIASEDSSEKTSGDTQQMPGQNGSFEMPGGNMPQMPNGNMPQMPGQNDSSEIPSGSMPQMPGQNGSFEMPSGDMSQMFGQNGSFEMPSGDMPQMSGNEGQGFDVSEIIGNLGGIFGGMGSEDVKLQYIDDDPESYANIFDNAKTDVSEADQERLICALKNLSDNADLENTLDMDEVLRYFVVHNFLVNGDSYTGNMIHNYYLHESDGKLGMIPWDYNLAYGTFMGGNASGSVNDSIDEVLSDRPMQAWIFSDETYTEQYHALFSEFVEKWFADGKLEKLIDDTAKMLRPYVEKDPTKFCTIEEFDTGVQTIRQFVVLRAEAVSRQLDGDTTAVETGDLNLSDMGSMGGGMGGGNMGSNMDGGMGGNMFGNMGGSMSGGSGDGNMPQREDVSSQNETDTAKESLEISSEPETEGENTPAGDIDPSDFNPGDIQSGSLPTGNSFSPGGDASFEIPSGVSDLFRWGLVGISAAVLAVGLLIALKKKY